MGQLRYNLTSIPGIPGQLLDFASIDRSVIVSAVAGVIIPPGVDVEIDATTGLLRPVNDLTAGWAAALHYGVSINDPVGFEQGYFPWAVPPTSAGSSGLGYPVGAVVPVLRMGRIYMAYDGGGTPTRLGAFNIWHSSDGTHPQGVATFSATAITVGAEIGAAPAGLSVWNPDLIAGSYVDGFGVTAGICGVLVNLG
jgi:hypothetical protein